MQWFCSTTTISTLKSVEERSGKPQKATHRMCAHRRSGTPGTLLSTLRVRPSPPRAQRQVRGQSTAQTGRELAVAENSKHPEKSKNDRGRNARRSSSRLLFRVPRTFPHRQITGPHAHDRSVFRPGCAAPGPAQASQARHTSEPGRGAERERPHTPLLLRTLATEHSGRHDTCN